MQKFVKGRTNNHLTWVMVDATDFATPESALSAATKIKIYGKLRGGTGANFVSSGTGSLTNDIQHVGASALGIYTIALAKADLSDASAAWYDQYIVSLSATGAAYQTLIVDGGIDDSALSAFQSRLSDIASAVLVVQSMASDAASAAVQANSRVLLVLSNVSDVQSALTVVQSMASDAASAAQQGNSRVLLVLSLASDIDSALTSRFSNLESLVTTTGVQLNASTMSDLRSAINGLTVSLDASNISDIASAVVAALPITSQVSDIYSLLSSLNSEFLSRVPKEMAARSQLSDIGSDLRSVMIVVQSQISDTYSQLSNALSGPMTASDLSDIASAVAAALASDFSDVLSRTTQINSRVALLQSAASDAHSAAVVTQSQASDIYSLLTAGVTIGASSMSDLRSAIEAGGGASVLSDILSAAQQANSRVLLNQSRVSDIYSLLTGVASNVSDVESQIDAGINVTRINGVTLGGAGTIGDPWGPA